MAILDNFTRVHCLQRQAGEGDAAIQRGAAASQLAWLRRAFFHRLSDRSGREAQWAIPARQLVSHPPVLRKLTHSQIFSIEG